jgi:multidrug resistance protein, MATE family
MPWCSEQLVLLRLIGQSTSFAAEAGHITFIVGCSLPAFMLFTTTSYFLEGIGRPVPGMTMMICAVVANVGLNWVFVYGHLGSPALGAEGAAFATLIVRVLLALGVMGFVFLFREATHFGIREPWRGSWRSWALQRRIGHADGVSMGIESGAFTSMNLMASILGTAHIAAYAIAISVSSIVFTVALGVASATAVLMGRSVGRHDWRELRRAGWLGLGLNSTVIACISMVLLVWPEWIVGLYSTDKSVARIAVPLILIIAAALIADGGQRVLVLSLRGCADTWLLTALHLLSYAGIMVPLGWVLAFPLGLASAVLVLAIAIASLVSVTVLASRFSVAFVDSASGRFGASKL